jgi:hypothetical protein
MITNERPGNAVLAAQIIKAIVGKTEDKTCLDLMCGEGNVSSLVPWKRSVHVDCENYSRKYKEADRRFVLGSWWFPPVESFDVCLCLDGIEHVAKPEGRLMIQKVPTWAEVPIFFTPLDPYVIDPSATDPGSHEAIKIGAWFFWMGGASESEVEKFLL